jgi:hypothetical protein
MTHSPIALGDMVYAITDRGNMYAINVEDATEKWLIGGIKKYLSGNENRLYCIDLAGNLAILDAKSGGLIGTLPMRSLDLHVMNIQTDRILIGSSTGMLQCLRETGNYWPVVHFGAVGAKKKKPTQPVRGGAKPADDGGKPAGADPFAAPPAGADPFAPPAGGAADPFAPPAAAPMPMGAAPDPFAPPP